MIPIDNWVDAVAHYNSCGESYVLVTVLNVRGSAPRDGGTKMLVVADRCIDTIGGGHLEFSAIEKARAMLVANETAQHLEEIPLGPKLGQCCGGRITLLFECFPATAPVIAVFGAGHVGRALISILAQLPLRLIWIDSRADEFPSSISAGIKTVVLDDPAEYVNQLPKGAYVVVMTHLHPLDYAIAEQVLARDDAAYLGVIGSQTKARRFRLRLDHREFSAAAIEKMHCPIGLDKITGKRPMEVAVSVAGQIIAQYQQHLPAVGDTVLTNEASTVEQWL